MSDIEYFNASVAGDYCGEAWVVRATDYEALQAENEALRARVAALVEALEKARDAIGSLPQDALGNVPDTQQRQGWHIRDELINDISTALAAAPQPPREGE